VTVDFLFAADPPLATEVATGGFWLPEQMSTSAPSIDWAYYVVLWISIILFVPIILITGYFVMKYRRRHPAQEPEPSPSHNQLLELGWTIPTIPIVTVFFYVGVHGFVDARTVPKNGYEIGVVAQQWSWLFEYPEGVKSGELHVPANQNVILTMRSNDVLHSLFVPVLRVKFDIVPGRFTKMWFNATRPVEANLFCTEYCGDNHAGMITKFVAHDEAGFKQWFEEAKDWRKWKMKTETGEERPYTEAEAGERFYRERGCMGCHSTDGSTKTGPSFKGLFGAPRDVTLREGGATRAEADENYIRESIVDPHAKVRAGFPAAMPSFKGQFRDDELKTIIEYIKTLK
jgi:cytochrome c oxidase subunit II